MNDRSEDGVLLESAGCLRGEKSQMTSPYEAVLDEEPPQPLFAGA